MRNFIAIVESFSKTFFHGSHEELEVGTILRGRGSDYESDWSRTNFYAALERYRPEGMLSHKDAVFMCDNADDIDAAGGGTEWLFHVRPLGRVERHDMNWGSAISGAIDDGADDAEIERLAHGYWAGLPYEGGETVWEYLTPPAEIVAVETY